MKKCAAVILMLFLFPLKTPAFTFSYDLMEDEFKKGLREYYNNYDKDINLEETIKEFLKQEQTPISLDECLEITLEYNFNIKSSIEVYKSYEYLHKYALSKFLPNVSYSWYSIYYKGQVLVGTALVDDFNELALSGSFEVSHELTKGGEQIFEAKAAKFAKKQKCEEYHYTKEEAILNTARAYWRLAGSKVGIEIHLKNYYERVIQLKKAEALESVGQGTKFDVIRQKNEVASAKRSLVEAMNEFRLRQAKLSNVMGIEVSTTLYPIEDVVKLNTLVDETISLEELYEVAKENRKDIKAIKNKIEMLKNEKRAIYTEFIPKARVTYQNQMEGTAKIRMGNSHVIGVYADWYLGENVGVGTITRAKSKLHEIEAQIQKSGQILIDIKEQLLDSYYNSRLLLKRVDITKEQVEYASEAVTHAQVRFEVGEGDFLDVISAQNQKVLAKIENLEAIIEYNINQVELLFDQGIIDVEKIVKDYNP